MAFSFPGIFLLEKITVSPAVRLTNLSIPFEILERAEFGSPWDPVQIMRRLDFGIRLMFLVETISGTFVR